MITMINNIKQLIFFFSRNLAYFQQILLHVIQIINKLYSTNVYLAQKSEFPKNNC
jgi:hypothetical protein